MNITLARIVAGGAIALLAGDAIQTGLRTGDQAAQNNCALMDANLTINRTYNNSNSSLWNWIGEKVYGSTFANEGIRTSSSIINSTLGVCSELIGKAVPMGVAGFALLVGRGPLAWLPLAVLGLFGVTKALNAGGINNSRKFDGMA